MTNNQTKSPAGRTFIPFSVTNIWSLDARPRLNVSNKITQHTDAISFHAPRVLTSPSRLTSDLIWIEKWMEFLCISSEVRDLYDDKLFDTPRSVSIIWYSATNIWYDKTRGYMNISTNSALMKESAQLEICQLSFVHTHVTNPIVTSSGLMEWKTLFLGTKIVIQSRKMIRLS